MNPEDFGKKPVNLEQAGNFLDKDFGSLMDKQIAEIRNAPILPGEMDALSQIRFLKIALSFLSDKGKEGFYKRTLLCRVAGATYEQMAKSCKTTPERIKVVEIDAIKCVKDKINTRKVLPFIKRKKVTAL